MLQREIGQHAVHCDANNGLAMKWRVLHLMRAERTASTFSGVNRSGLPEKTHLRCNTIEVAIETGSIKEHNQTAHEHGNGYAPFNSLNSPKSLVGLKGSSGFVSVSASCSAPWLDLRASFDGLAPKLICSILE